MILPIIRAVRIDCYVASKKVTKMVAVALLATILPNTNAVVLICVSRVTLHAVAPTSLHLQKCHLLAHKLYVET